MGGLYPCNAPGRMVREGRRSRLTADADERDSDFISLAHICLICNEPAGRLRLECGVPTAGVIVSDGCLANPSRSLPSDGHL